MISKINSFSINSTNFNGTPTIFDKFQKNLYQPESYLPQTNGSEALSNYNKVIVNKKDFNSEVQKLIISNIPEPTTLKGDEIETLEGEKLLNNDGTLGIIVVKGEKTSKEYYVDNENHRIDQIIERDNKTGTPLRIDSFGLMYNKLQSATVREFSPDTKNLVKETYFSDGKLFNIKTFDNDKEISNEFIRDGKLNYITVSDNKTGEITEYTIDDNGNVEEITIKNALNTNSKSIKIKDNKIEETREYKSEPIENIYGITPDNIDLKPSEFIEKPDITQLEGEKKFRSDNSLESLTVKDGDNKIQYHMDLKGNLEGIKYYDNDKLTKSVEYNLNGSSNITEYSDDKTSKITYFNKDKQVNLIILQDKESGEFVKSADFTADGKYLKSYEDKENPKYGELYLKFDQDKNLISAQNSKSTVKITKGEE